MSSNTVDFDVDSYDEYLPLAKPSPVIFFVALTSVVLGVAIGTFGIIRTFAGATESQEYILGSIGYALTGIIPVLCYKIFSTGHTQACRDNHEQPYDIHGGHKLRSRIRKTAVVGLVVAIIPIWVFFFPIAQSMIK
jgi:hypothetical protein